LTNLTLLLTVGVPSVLGMHLTVLAASGGTGLAVTRQALERGHTVTAIARVTLPSAGLRTVAGDVLDPASIAEVIDAEC
jgi:uncharacterized protein